MKKLAVTEKPKLHLYPKNNLRVIHTAVKEIGPGI